MRIKKFLKRMISGIGLVFLFSSFLLAGTYRNVISIEIDEPSNSIITYNGTDGSSIVSFNNSTDTVTLGNTMNYFKPGDVFTATLKNNYSSEIKSYVLVSVGTGLYWIHNNCNATSCTKEYQPFSSFSDDFVNSTKEFSSIPARGSMPIISFYINSGVTYDYPVVLWAFAFSKEDDNLYHLVGMDSKTIFLYPNISLY